LNHDLRHGGPVLNPTEKTLEEARDIDLVHDIGSRIAAADPLHAVLERIIEVVTEAVRCDSCFLYVLEKDQLTLRASKNPHADVVDRIGLALGEGITGWVAANNKPVAISANASDDRRFAKLGNLPEDRFEAFLSVPVLCRGKLVGVINVQHRAPHTHSRREIKLITTLGYLVGAEIELARMDLEKSQLTHQLETRKVMERAKGILQRDMGLDEEGAYIALQKQSRQRRKPLREIAEAIILTEDLRRARK
jgi:signal transduction protein with GAF and PtsI domain